MSEYTVVNSRAPRIDAPAKATGSAVFIDDIRIPGMLYGSILHSPLAHAGILNIDTSRAKRLPGVKAVVTAEEAGLVKYGVSPARYDETLFCHDKVRYLGDELAAVAAVDLETAMEALSLIRVEYEELPAVFTIEEATAGEASAKDYETVVETAGQAFLKWRMTPAPLRGQVIREIGQILREHKDDLGALVSMEMGKIRPEGLGEVQEMIGIADFAVGLSRQLYGLTMHSERPHHRLYEQWHPLGPIGVVTAFNFPVGVVLECPHRSRMRRRRRLEAQFQGSQSNDRRSATDPRELCNGCRTLLKAQGLAGRGLWRTEHPGGGGISSLEPVSSFPPGNRRL